MVAKKKDNVAQLLGSDTIGRPPSPQLSKTAPLQSSSASAIPASASASASASSSLTKNKKIMMSGTTITQRSLKNSAQRGTFHGTYHKNTPKPHDTKVKDLLLEIERESKLKLLQSQKQKAARSETTQMRKQRQRKRRREHQLEAKDRELGWTGNFGFGDNKVSVVTLTNLH